MYVILCYIYYIVTSCVPDEIEREDTNNFHVRSKCRRWFEKKKMKNQVSRCSRGCCCGNFDANIVLDTYHDIDADNYNVSTPWRYL